MKKTKPIIDGHKLRQLIADKGLKNYHLAAAIDRDQSCISDLIHGRREFKIEWLPTFSEVLNMQPSDLLVELGLLTPRVKMTDEQIAETCWIKILGFFEGNHLKALAWFSTRNPMFGGTHPITMLECGRGEKVLKFIETALEGH